MRLETDVLSTSREYIWFAVLQAAVFGAVGTGLAVVVATVNCGCFTQARSRELTRNSRTREALVVVLVLACSTLCCCCIAANISQSHGIHAAHTGLAAALDMLWGQLSM